MAKINLQNGEWCQIVFDGRNQEYGAYELRKGYSKIASRSIVIAIFAFTFFACLPILASVLAKKEKVSDFDVDDMPGMTDIAIETPEELPPPPIELPPPPAVKELKFTTPEIVPSEELNPEDVPPPAETVELDDLLGDETRDGLSKFEVAIDAPEDGEGTEKIVGKVVDSDKLYPFASIETKPVFPGGMDKIMPFIMKHFDYPSLAKENNISGTVIVQFTIDKDGSVIDVLAVRGKELGGGLAEEAVKAVKAMPKWKPGEQNGRKVKVRYTIPVVTRLQ